ncbi:MAG: VOC family protein [Firmicutes bacterium]|nr:VOC family protein [Bacillota bacterium]
MKFCWCTIRVKNLEESLKFYREIVGLSLNRRFKAGPKTEIAFVGAGETEIELLYEEDNQSPQQFEGISLGFEVESVDEMIKFITDKGLKVHSGPVSPNPSVKFFFIKDPNGLSIQFVENIK